MTGRSVSCPSCGAQREVHNPGIVMFVCEYCSNAVYWDQERLQAAGKQAVLPEGFSRLYRGAAGSLNNKRFLVAGRARYSFGRGFWDEWYLELFDQKMEWLSEDNHELALQRPVSGVKVGPFDSYQPGTSLVVRDRTFVVQETGEAECIGLEGELPKQLQVGERYAYVDASSPDGRFTLGIEYDDQTPTVYAGRWLQYSMLRLDDEGQSW